MDLEEAEIKHAIRKAARKEIENRPDGEKKSRKRRRKKKWASKPPII